MPARLVDCENVNASIIHRELDRRLLALIETQTRLDCFRILGQEVAKIRLGCKLLFFFLIGLFVLRVPFPSLG
jgi:hypothetical protein